MTDYFLENDVLQAIKSASEILNKSRIPLPSMVIFEGQVYRLTWKKVKDKKK